MVSGSSVVKEVLPNVTVVSAPRLWVRFMCGGVLRSLGLLSAEIVSASDAICGVSVREQRKDAFLRGSHTAGFVSLCGLATALLKGDRLD